MDSLCYHFYMASTYYKENIIIPKYNFQILLDRTFLCQDLKVILRNVSTFELSKINNTLPFPISIINVSSESNQIQCIDDRFFSKLLKIISGLLTRSLPFRFIANMANVLVTAFGTSSSNATLPGLVIISMSLINKQL
jgi:hypothetical protein